MEQGDFTALAEDYINRSGYSLRVLKLLGQYTGARCGPDYTVADVGAGTGKLTENLCECGWRCVAVEPNDAMRAEGLRLTGGLGVRWVKGAGEATTLEAGSVDWVLMGSALHWVRLEEGLAEFYRILKPRGFFTALWNPRDVGRSALHTGIEARVRAIVPELRRKSSGSGEFTQDLARKLCSTGHFVAPLLVEDEYEITMSRERYLGAWRSVNDIQSQAGPERFEMILRAIAEEVAHLEQVTVPYKTRAWTVQRRD